MSGDESGGACFVVSSGRCGSTLLSNILRAHPQVLSLSELFTVLGGPRAFARPELDGAQLWQLLSRVDADLYGQLRAAPPAELLRPLDGPGREAARAVSPLLLVPLPHLTDRPEALLEEIRAQVLAFECASVGVQFARLFAWLAMRLGRSLWVERSGGSLEYQEHLLAHFPGARRLLLLRDGPDCALSMSRHALFRIRVARVLANDPTLAVEQCLAREIPLDRFGAYWSALMARAQHALRDPRGGETLIIRYERLLAAPQEQLARLAGFLGVPCQRAWLAEARAAMGPAQQCAADLPAAQRAALERVCRPGERVLRVLAAEATG